MNFESVEKTKRNSKKNHWLNGQSRRWLVWDPQKHILQRGKVLASETPSLVSKTIYHYSLQGCQPHLLCNADSALQSVGTWTLKLGREWLPGLIQLNLLPQTRELQKEPLVFFPSSTFSLASSAVYILRHNLSLLLLTTSLSLASSFS